MTIYRTLQSIGLAGLFSMSSLVSVSGQEQAVEDDAPIIIVNRDGEAVDSAQLELGNKDQEAKPNVRKPSFAENRARAMLGAGAAIRNNNGKITIVNSDGEKQEIDVQGARSVSVSHSSKTVVVDGVKKREFVGKAVVVDADGQRHEYDLAPQEAGGADGPGIELMPGFHGTLRSARAKNQYMVGLHCKPVSDALAAQLQLEPNTGLVVQAIGKGSPAAQAGIEKHDILMFAEDQELSKISDLNEVVDKAGKEEAKVSLTIIRGGKELGIDVGVVERTNRNNPIAGFPELPGMNFELLQAMPGVIIHQNLDGAMPNGPEIVLEGLVMPEMPGLNEQMQDQMDQMREDMDELRNQMQKQLER